MEETIPSILPQPEVPENKDDHKKLIIVVIIIALLMVVLISGAGWYIWQSKYKPIKSNEPTHQATQTGNAEIDKMLKNVKYVKVGAATASICSDERKVCYEGETVLLKLNYPVPDKLKSVVANLQQDKWLLDDGSSVSSVLESDTIATSDERPNDIPDRDLLFKEPNADKNYGYFGLLNMGTFGTKKTLYRGNEGAYFTAFSKQELQTNEEPYYILKSEVPGSESFNFKDIIAQLDDNSFILSITYGHKTDI